jgi:uncharacterized heparinase superfamily protein
MIGEQKFCFLNECHEIAVKESWNNEQLAKLWLYNLHYFDDLNAEDYKLRADWHRDLIHRWVSENPPALGNGWEPYPLSLRIVNWIKWALQGNEMDTSWQSSLATQVHYLSERLEYHLLGNHLFANAKALLIAGLFFRGPEAESWYRVGLEIVERELSEQVLSDGGNFELSTMYHAIFLEDLLDLVNVHRAFTRETPKGVEATIPKMINWLITMCHPDGEISFFNDAALGVTPSVDELLGYAERLGFSRSPTVPGLVDLSESGYSRVALGDAVALVDRAAVGADYLPGHAHADTLSFELSLFGQRVIVNSGTSVYGTGHERQRQRGTAVHSTVVIDGKDSSEVWGGFRVARRARVFHRKTVNHDNHILLSSCHDGYKRLKGKPVHCREWIFSDDSLLIKDQITGRGMHSIDVVFPLHLEIGVLNVTEDRATLVVAGNKVEIKLDGDGTLVLKKSTYHPEFGISIENSQLIYRFAGRIPAEIKTRIYW